MKIRNGFVSNSSSASFIITWRKLNNDFNLDKELQFSDLNMEYINKNTEEISDGVFKTEYYTTMMNTMQDFGDGCAFYTILKHCNDVEVINSHVESDY